MRYIFPHEDDRPRNGIPFSGGRRAPLEADGRSSSPIGVRTSYLLEPDPDFRGEFRLWIAAMEEARHQTKTAVHGLGPEQLSWRPPLAGNSIGQLLRHIALIELDWILTEVCRFPLQALPDDAPAMLHLQDPMADPGPAPLSEYLDALDYARAETRRRLFPLAASMIEERREYGGELTRRTFSIRWILFHLVSHEAHHQGQIAAVHRMLRGIEAAGAGVGP
jgi:uncharacterized damage-inducible protein DinB